MKRCYLACFLIILIINAGCSQFERTSNLPNVTQTKKPTLTTKLPISDETETPRPILTPSSIPSLLLSVTPFPSLSPNEIDHRILELLSNNGGCKLPCWWGIIPGKTSWNETWSLLSPFDPEPFIGDSQAKVHLLNGQTVSFLIPVSESISASQGIHISMWVENVIETISIYPIDQAVIFDLPNFLAQYGLPSEVWIHAYRSYLGGIPPADVLLFYSEQGILARYSTNLTDINEDQDTANICFDSTPSLDLWSPEENINFDKAQDIARLDYKKYDKPLLPLEKATDITIKQFYDYRTKDKVCITTKPSLWTDP